jgi:hypothetical protein
MNPESEDVKSTTNTTELAVIRLFIHDRIMGISSKTNLKFPRKKELGKRVIGDATISVFVMKADNTIQINGNMNPIAPIQSTMCRIVRLK